MNFLTYVVLLTLQLSSCWSKEKYSPVNDFLSHEAGVQVLPYDKNSNSQFPTLKPPYSASTGNPRVTSPNNKRDYVAPQFPTLRPITKSSTLRVTQNPLPSTQSSKRDYVAPHYPTLKPSSLTNKANLGTTTKTSLNPKRDYVAPAFTTAKPQQDNAKAQQGKVKDLINFFDGQGNQGSTVIPKVPNYSSILKGPTVGPQSVTPSHGLGLSTKPSFSSIASGSRNNKPSTQASTTKVGATGGGNLPSSILNNNKNLQGVNPPTDAELQTLSEELLKKDVNNAAKLITVSYQEKTSSGSKDDKAPRALLTISPEVWNIPTIQKFLPLLDNYERDTLINEHVTPQERNEDNAFMDAIMSTNVIRHLMSFLKDKGYVTQDPRQQREFLKQMWFGLYSRGKGKISSSGFEHVFVSELKNSQISGLHNWIYFSKEETANRVNYLGYLKYANFADKGAVLKMHFNQQGVDKPVGTMFIGTSPELEMSLYTLCYVTRVDNDCKLKLGNNEVDIVTYNFRYRSKNYIGSAYPQI
ncbi:uridylate-specific endoribonuclease D [Pieris brassicae]|uniref:uridylate-specific endoribonuclease D n=1 Tax=Pieris brassicae TaxID=7116 RepID=UPI001E660080|nr:uridylate-specific endoribonuclease D [Pieris brassicae]